MEIRSNMFAAAGHSSKDEVNPPSPRDQNFKHDVRR